MKKTVIAGLIIASSMTAFAQQQMDLFAVDTTLEMSKAMHVSEAVIEAGGIQSETGRSLVRSLDKSTYYVSPFERLVPERIYANTNSGITVTATNSTRQGTYALFIVEAFVPAGTDAAAAQEKTLDVARALSANFDIVVQTRPGEEPRFDFTQSKSIQKMRLDVFIKFGHLSVESLAEGLEKSFEKMSESTLDRLGNERRVERTIRAGAKGGVEVDLRKAIQNGKIR